MKAEAHYGNVLLVDRQTNSRLLTPEEAADLLLSLAVAIQNTGDICEPRRVFLHEAVRAAVTSFKKESA